MCSRLNYISSFLLLFFFNLFVYSWIHSYARPLFDDGWFPAADQRSVINIMDNQNERLFRSFSALWAIVKKGIAIGWNCNLWMADYEVAMTAGFLEVVPSVQRSLIVTSTFAKQLSEMRTSAQLCARKNFFDAQVVKIFVLHLFNKWEKTFNNVENSFQWKWSLWPIKTANKRSLFDKTLYNPQYIFWWFFYDKRRNQGATCNPWYQEWIIHMLAICLDANQKYIARL